MTFRELLKKHNIKQLDIAYKLKCDTSNLLTNIPYKELIGTELKD